MPELGAPTMTQTDTYSVTGSEVNPVRLALMNNVPPPPTEEEEKAARAYRDFGVMPQSPEDLDRGIYSTAVEGVPSWVPALPEDVNKPRVPGPYDQALPVLPPEEYYQQKLENIVGSQPPQMQQPPIPGVGTHVRRALTSMIPIVGKAIVEPELEREKQLQEAADISNRYTHEAWREQQALARPLLLQEYKRRGMLHAVQNGERFFMARYPNASPDQWRHWAMEYAGLPDTGYKTPSFESVYVQTPAYPEWILAQKSSLGEWTIRDPMTRQKVTLGPQDIINEMPMNAVWGASAQEKQWQADRDQKWAFYNHRAGVTPFPDNYKPNALDYANAEKYWEENKSTGGVQQILYRELLKKRDPKTGLLAHTPETAAREVMMTVPTGTYVLGAGERKNRAVERAYNSHMTKLEAREKPFQNMLMRLANLDSSLKAGMAQTDALIAPELLTLMAGGMGSGLRMSEAEINRINKARTNWEGLKIAIGKINPFDPASYRQFSPLQIQVIRDLLDEVKLKANYMQYVYARTRRIIESSESPDEIKKAYNQLDTDVNEINLGNLIVSDGEVWVKRGDKFFKRKEEE